MKTPSHFVTLIALATALGTTGALVGCGSSNSTPSSPSRPEFSGPRSKARPSGSPEDEGSVVSAESTKKGVNPRDLEQAEPPTADEPATPVPAYTKKQVTADLSNLSSTENSLLAFGLKIVVTKSADGSPKSVDWDYKLMDSVDVSVFKAIPALENYAKVGHAFLANYDKEFTIDGSGVTADRLAKREIATLIAKIQLVENSVDSLKKQAAKAKKK